jgi:mevalonate kinase
MGKGSGFGKTILIGDSFLLYGVPAVLSSLPYKTEVEVVRVPGTGWEMTDERVEVPGYKQSKEAQRDDSVNIILEETGIDVSSQRLLIKVGGDLLAGSGVGASAAICVGLARALNDEFDLGLDSAGINHLAWRGEFAYHGRPSGVDNTASCYGGLILFKVEEGKPHFESLSIHEPLDIVLGNTGISADTARLRKITEGERERDPERYSRMLELISQQVIEVREGLERGDFREVGRIMTENHKILIELGISHEVLIRLCDLAIRHGALGAKLTGGGMGGFMIALTPGKALQEKVAGELEALGYHTIRATIGAEKG